MFSRKIRHVAIRSGSIRWISIRFDAIYISHIYIDIGSRFLLKIGHLELRIQSLYHKLKTSYPPLYTFIQ